MTITTKTSVNIKKYRDFGSIEKAKLSEIHNGFSERLNWLLDLSNLNAPPLNNGRVSWTAEVTNSSRPAVMDWLKHDKPPKSVTLRKLVIFLHNHLPPIFSEAPVLEAWLRYGPEVLQIKPTLERGFQHQA